MSKTRQGLKNPPPFARLLRFWRQTRDISQESLALQVGMSTRHLSFLENGRSKPSIGVIYQLSEHLGLGHRDCSTLLVAAGFLPNDDKHLSEVERRWQTKSMTMRLRDLEPMPSWVGDPYGNILMINRGWLHLNQSAATEDGCALSMNAYHRYFSSSGLRDQLLNWEDLACALLLNLQQEVLLTGDPKAEALLHNLLQYPDVPTNWQRRAADVPYSQSFKVQYRALDGKLTTFIAANSTFGATPFVPQPRIMISVLHPLDPEQWVKAEDISALEHPLLFNQFNPPEKTPNT